MKLNITPNSKEHFELRKTKIGASDAPVIMGISPFKNKTPIKLWESKCGLIEDTDGYIMKKGRTLEDMAREAFIRQTGIFIEPSVYGHDKIQYLIASLDGISKCGKFLVELKYGGDSLLELAKQGKIPDHYNCQIQIQLEVLDLEFGYYAVYDEVNDLVVILKIKRDKLYFQAVKQEMDQFWECMTKFIPPALKPRDYAVNSSPEWEKAAMRWIEVMKQMKSLQEEESALRAALISLSGNRNCKGAGVKVQKIVRKGNIQYDKIDALKSVDLEEYRKEPSVTYRVEIIDEIPATGAV